MIDVWDWGSWGSRFIRYFNDWELEEVDALFGRLHSYSIGLGTFDTIVWLETKDGDFSIWSFYSSLASRRVEPFLYDSVEFLGPFRASFFAWEATWAKILTHDQLRGRGWKMPNRCYMCKAEEEIVDHLLLHYPKASTLWQLVCALFHIQWVMHSSIWGVLLNWNGVPIDKKRKKVAPLCIFGSVWRERNRGAFEDKECLDQSFESSFLYLFWDWVRVYMGDDMTSLIEFVDWLGSP